MNHCSRHFAVAIIAYLLTSWFASAAQGQNEPFYKGKTVRFVVGSAPANFYDSWARLIARYWGKHIPGNPNVIVQNMPGAGSITAVNYVYGVAKPDGLTVVLPNNSIYIEQLVGRREAQFDLQKLKPLLLNSATLTAIKKDSSLADIHALWKADLDRGTDRARGELRLE